MFDFLYLRPELTGARPLATALIGEVVTFLRYFCSHRPWLNFLSLMWV